MGIDQMNAVMAGARSQHSAGISSQAIAANRGPVQGNQAGVQAANGQISAMRSEAGTQAQTQEQLDIEATNADFDAQIAGVDAQAKPLDKLIEQVQEQISTTQGELTSAQNKQTDTKKKHESAGVWSTLGKDISEGFDSNIASIQQRLESLKAQLSALMEQRGGFDVKKDEIEGQRGQAVANVKADHAERRAAAASEDAEFNASQTQFLGEMSGMDTGLSAKLTEIDIQEQVNELLGGDGKDENGEEKDNSYLYS